MQIPTRRECLDFMERVDMPANIRRHSFRVAQVALYLGSTLMQQGWNLHLPLLEAGALLHDIAKGLCLNNGGNHAKIGADLVRRWGYPEIASIVSSHVIIRESCLHDPIDESMLVNYADKRVKHDEIVDLATRFVDLIERYAKTTEHRDILLRKQKLYALWERRLFSNLPFGPEELNRLRRLTPRGEEIVPVGDNPQQ